MERLFKKYQNLTAENLVNTAWISTAIALILTIPPLAVFLGIFFNTNQVLVAALCGFGLHFALFAFSEKISKALLWLTN